MADELFDQMLAGMSVADRDALNHSLALLRENLLTPFPRDAETAHG